MTRDPDQRTHNPRQAQCCGKDPVVTRYSAARLNVYCEVCKLSLSTGPERIWQAWAGAVEAVRHTVAERTV